MLDIKVQELEFRRTACSLPENKKLVVLFKWSHAHSYDKTGNSSGLFALPMVRYSIQWQMVRECRKVFLICGITENWSLSL